MSKNLIRRQSYLCDPLTWTPRSVYGDVPRCLSWGGGGGANRGGGVKKNFWQPSLINGLFGPRSCWSSKTQCSPTKIRLHLRNILIKDSPCPEKKKQQHYFSLDGTDDVTCATWSSEVISRLGTIQDWVTEGPACLRANEPSSQSRWQGSQASPSDLKKLHREAGDCAPAEQTPASNDQHSEWPCGWNSGIFRAEKEVQTLHCPNLDVDGLVPTPPLFYYPLPCPPRACL